MVGVDVLLNDNDDDDDLRPEADRELLGGVSCTGADGGTGEGVEYRGRGLSLILALPGGVDGEEGEEDARVDNLDLDDFGVRDGVVGARFERYEGLPLKGTFSLVDERTRPIHAPPIGINSNGSSVSDWCSCAVNLSKDPSSISRLKCPIYILLDGAPVLDANLVAVITLRFAGSET